MSGRPQPAAGGQSFARFDSNVTGLWYSASRRRLGVTTAAAQWREKPGPPATGQGFPSPPSVRRCWNCALVTRGFISVGRSYIAAACCVALVVVWRVCRAAARWRLHKNLIGGQSAAWCSKVVTVGVRTNRWTVHTPGTTGPQPMRPAKYATVAMAPHDARRFFLYTTKPKIHHFSSLPLGVQENRNTISVRSASSILLGLDREFKQLFRFSFVVLLCLRSCGTAQVTSQTQPDLCACVHSELPKSPVMTTAALRPASWSNRECCQLATPPLWSTPRYTALP